MELAKGLSLVRLRFLFFLEGFLLVLVASVAAVLSASFLKVASCVVNAKRVVFGLETFTLSLCFLSSHCQLISEATEATV